MSEMDIVRRLRNVAVPHGLCQEAASVIEALDKSDATITDLYGRIDQLEERIDDLNRQSRRASGEAFDRIRKLESEPAAQPGQSRPVGQLPSYTGREKVFFYDDGNISRRALLTKRSDWVDRHVPGAVLEPSSDNMYVRLSSSRFPITPEGESPIYVPIEQVLEWLNG